MKTCALYFSFFSKDTIDVDNYTYIGKAYEIPYEYYEAGFSDEIIHGISSS